MMKSASLITIIYLILLVWMSNQHQNCKFEQHLTIIEEDQNNLRHLQSETSHNMIIYGHFPEKTVITDLDIGLLRNIFLIASKYFQKVIKVRKIQQSLTRYPIRSGSCGIVVPDTFIKNGFNQDQMDLVIFIVIEKNLQQSYVASAAACVKVRRPIYGAVNFNVAYIQTNLKNKASYHLNIYVTMHELTHILGFNNLFYSQFYTSPTSQQKFRMDEVVTSVPGVPSRKMIITPNVKRYVQGYFGCRDQRIGGLLQDQGSSGSAGSHWERQVYMDEMMTASTFLSGLKVSALTLNLLKDTGFYDEIDVSLSQSLQFGKFDGCSFAVGLSNPKPQFSCGSSCDFYNVFGGYCSDRDQFGNGALYIRPYSNMICTFPQNQKGSFNKNFQFNSNSRCFDVINGSKNTHPHCYLASCFAGSVKIVVNGEDYICNRDTKAISIPGGSLLCPLDFEVFCSVKTCPNWCDSHGICINGSCICIPPFSGPSCNVGCPVPTLFDYETNSCVTQCQQKVIFNRGCIVKCPPTYFPNQYNVCRPCQTPSECYAIFKLQSIWLVLFMIIVLI